MRDRMDAEIWNAHHDQFSEWLHLRLRAAAGAARQGGRLARVPVQFASAVAVVSLAGLGLGTLFV